MPRTIGVLGDSDHAFVKSLRGRLGREIAAYVENFAFVASSPTEVEQPVRSANMYKNNIVLSLNKQMANKERDAAEKLTLGLPSSLPPFVAVVNLMGTRGVVYSSQASLVRVLCCSSSVTNAEGIIVNVDMLVKWAQTPTEGETRHLLVFFSLPWGGGLKSGFWEIRTISVSTLPASPRMVLDSQLVFSSNMSSAQSGLAALDSNGNLVSPGAIPTGSPSSLLPGVNEKSVAEMNKNYVAVSLDADESEAAQSESEQTRKLEDILRATITQRREIQDELSKTQKEFEDYKLMEKGRSEKYHLEATKKAEAMVACAEKAREKEAQACRAAVVLKESAEKKLMNLKAKTAEDMAEGLKKNSDLQREIVQIKRRQEQTSKLYNATTSRHAESLVQLNAQLASANDTISNLKEADEEKKAKIEDLEAAVAAAVDESNALKEAAAVLRKELDDAREVEAAHKKVAASWGERDEEFTRLVLETSSLTQQLGKAWSEVQELRRENLRLKMEKAVQESKHNADTRVLVSEMSILEERERSGTLRPRADERPETSDQSTSCELDRVVHLSARVEQLEEENKKLSAAPGGKTNYVSPDLSMPEATMRLLKSIEFFAEWVSYASANPRAPESALHLPLPGPLGAFSNGYQQPVFNWHLPPGALLPTSHLPSAASTAIPGQPARVSNPTNHTDGRKKG